MQVSTWQIVSLEKGEEEEEEEKEAERVGGIIINPSAQRPKSKLCLGPSSTNRQVKIMGSICREQAQGTYEPHGHRMQGNGIALSLGRNDSCNGQKMRTNNFNDSPRRRREKILQRKLVMKEKYAV